MYIKNNKNMINFDVTTHTHTHTHTYTHTHTHTHTRTCPNWSQFFFLFVIFI